MHLTEYMMMIILQLIGGQTKMLVNLSKDEMSTILYVLEGYISPSDDYAYDPDFREDIDGIFEKFEGIIDACECQSQKQQEQIQ